MLIRKESEPQAYILVANDQSSQNVRSKFPSQTNLIWKFFQGDKVAAFAGRLCSRRNRFGSCYFFDNNHTGGLLNISALHVQYGIQAFHSAKFKRPECARLHLRELQSQKFSLGSIRPKTPYKSAPFAVLMGAIAPILYCHSCLLYL